MCIFSTKYKILYSFEHCALTSIWCETPWADSCHVPGGAMTRYLSLVMKYSTKSCILWSPKLEIPFPYMQLIWAVNSQHVWPDPKGNQALAESISDHDHHLRLTAVGVVDTVSHRRRVRLSWIRMFNQRNVDCPWISSGRFSRLPPSPAPCGSQRSRLLHTVSRTGTILIPVELPS